MYISVAVELQLQLSRCFSVYPNFNFSHWNFNKCYATAFTLSPSEIHQQSHCRERCQLWVNRILQVSEFSTAFSSIFLLRHYQQLESKQIIWSFSSALQGWIKDYSSWVLSLPNGLSAIAWIAPCLGLFQRLNWGVNQHLLKMSTQLNFSFFLFQCKRAKSVILLLQADLGNDYSSKRADGKRILVLVYKFT